jgi:lipid-A-disaccharide synthase
VEELVGVLWDIGAGSGSVSLELLYHEKPSAILYWVPWLQYLLVRYLLIRVRYITLVNLLAADDPFRGPIRPFDPTAPGAERVPLPEYPTHEDKSEELASHVVQWLSDDKCYAAKVSQLRELKNQFAQPGASLEAARYILRALNAGRAHQRAA